MKRANTVPELLKPAAVLTLAVVLAAGLTAWPTLAGNTAEVKEISARELFTLMSSSEDLVIIDISTPGEYDEGHIKGSLRGDFMSIRTRPQQYLESLGIKKSDTIVLTCETGRKSFRMAAILLRTDYHGVYNLAGGKIDWARSGFDLVADNGK